MHVLVATTFSSSSECALCRALFILSKLGGRLTVTHIVQSNQSDESILDERAVASRLLKDLARTCQDAIGIETDWRLEVDDACVGILAAADAADVDLIVMGSATSRATDVFGGNIVERVARRSVRPVLVSAEATTLPHSNVLLALDFDEASRVAARDALSMGMLDEANVTVMHAFDTPAAGMLKRAFVPGDEVQRYVFAEERKARIELEKLQEELDLLETSEVVIAMKGSAARTIREMAHESDSDLIVLGTNQRTGIGRALLGSVAADVARDPYCDVLIIPRSAAA